MINSIDLNLVKIWQRMKIVLLFGIALVALQARYAASQNVRGDPPQNQIFATIDDKYKVAENVLVIFT